MIIISYDPKDGPSICAFLAQILEDRWAAEDQPPHPEQPRPKQVILPHKLPQAGDIVI
ncbi:MAG: hypothetical protein ACXAC5_01855 [Promethearchaeota archaeon]|jgi:hypothetical protein